MSILLSTLSLAWINFEYETGQKHEIEKYINAGDALSSDILFLLLLFYQEIINILIKH